MNKFVLVEGVPHRPCARCGRLRPVSAFPSPAWCSACVDARKARRQFKARPAPRTAPFKKACPTCSGRGKGRTSATST